MSSTRQRCFPVYIKSATSARLESRRLLWISGIIILLESKIYIYVYTYSIYMDTYIHIHIYFTYIHKYIHTHAHVYNFSPTPEETLIKTLAFNAGAALPKRRRWNLSPEWWPPVVCTAGPAHPSVRMLLTAQTNHNTCLGEITAGSTRVLKGPMLC